MYDKIAAVITIAIAIAVYVLTTFQIWPAVIAIIACALISKSLKMIFQEKLDKNFPPLAVFILSGDDLSGMTTKGLRVIVITEKIFFHTETEADKNYILDMIDRYADVFCESSKIFKYRYNYVRKHNLPYQKAYAACRNDKRNLKVIYRRWYEDSGVSKFGKFEEDRDSFMADETVIDPRDNSEHRAMIQFIFDPNLPLPDENYQ